MLDAEREAASLVGRNPGLLVGGGLVAVLVVGAYLAGVLVARGTALPTWAWLLLAVGIGGVLRVVLLPFPLAGLYAAGRRAREASAGRATTLAVLGGAVRNYRRLLGATVAARLMTVALAVPLFGLLLAGDTLLRYVLYARGANPLSLLHWNHVSVIFLVLLAGALARFVVAFYDLPVLSGGVAGSRGWRVGLRFVRRRPKAWLRYGVGRVLLWSPAVVAPLAADYALGRMETATTAPSGVLAVLGVVWLAVVGVVVAPTLVAAHHVVVYGRTVEPVLREPTPTGSGTDRTVSPAVAPDERDGGSGGPGRRRVAVAALAALLVTATVAGAAAVRIGDVRPMPGDEVRPVDASMDAETVVENARLLTERTSHREVKRIYEVDPGTGERTPAMTWRAALDRGDRRMTVTLVAGANDSAEGASRGFVYGSTGTLANSPLGTGEWLVEPSPGYAEVADGASLAWSDVNLDRGDWRVLDRADDAVVVGFEEGTDPGGDAGRHLTDRRVRVHVDPATGRPTRVVERRTFTTYAENGTVTERERLVHVTEFSAYGTADVERPDGADDRGALEWLAALVFY